MAETPKLERVLRFDSVPVKARWTAEGFLVDKPIVTSCGIFEYHKGGKLRRELRLPEHVFSPESLASYRGKPVIITHNAKMVTSDNAPDEVIGTILSDGIKDGDDVRVDVVIHDTDAMIRSGYKELSLGYTAFFDETPGVWNGKPYDAIQTDILINHLAIVDKARAGKEARLNIDSKTTDETGGKRMKNQKKPAMTADELKKTVTAYEKRRKARLDGEDEPSAIPEKIIIEGIVKPQAGAADDDTNPVASEGGEGEKKEITLAEKVQEVRDRRDRRDADGDPADVEGAKGIIAQQDEDISTVLELLEQLQAAKDFSSAPPQGDDGGGEPNTDGDGVSKPRGDDGGEKPMNADSIDRLMAERLELARIGDKLNLDGLDKLKPIEAKKQIVKAIEPGIRLDGKSNGYINAAFDIAKQKLKSRKDTDYQRKQMFNMDSASNPAEKSGASAAREHMINQTLGFEED